MKNIIMLGTFFLLLALWTQAQELLGPSADSTKARDWSVKVSLDNGSTIEGIVLGDRFVEIPSGSFYQESENFRAPGAGIRVWYVKNAPGFVFLPYAQVLRVVKTGRLAPEARATIEEKIRQKISEAKVINEQERKSREEKLKQAGIGVTEAELAEMSIDNLRKKLNKQDVLAKLPPDARQLYESYSPDEGWNVDRYQELKARLGRSSAKFVKREVTLPDGSKRTVIQKGPPSGGVTPREKDFVDNFDKWVMAVEAYKHEEGILLEELRKSEMDKLNKTKEAKAAELAKANKEDVDKAETKPEDAGKDQKRSEQDIEEIIEKSIRAILYGKTAEAKLEGIRNVENLGEKASKAVQSLNFALKDPMPEVRKAAIYAMAKIRKPEKDVLENLLNTLEMGDTMLRREAAAALALLDNALLLETYGRMTVALGDEDAVVRYRTIRLIEKMGNKKALADIQKRIFDPDVAVQVATASALLAFRGTNDVAIVRLAVEPLLRGLGHQDPPVRLLAAQKIAQINDPALLPKIEPLIGKMDDPTKSVLEPLVKQWKFAIEQKRKATSAPVAKPAPEEEDEE